MGGRGIREVVVWIVGVGLGCRDGESCVSYVYSKNPTDVIIGIAYTFIAITFLRDNKKYACNISLVDYCLLVTERARSFLSQEYTTNCQKRIRNEWMMMALSRQSLSQHLSSR